MENVSIKIPLNEVTAESINQLAAPWITAAENANAAAVEYADNIKLRQSALEAQAHEIHGQLDALYKQRDTLVEKINDLFSRSKFDEAAEVDARLEAVGKEIAALTRKLGLVSSTNLKGDPALYKAAKAAYEAMEAERAPYRATIAELQAAVAAEIQRLEAVGKDLFYAARKDPSRYACDAFHKVDRHFRELDRIEQESKDKAAAERKAQQEMAGRTFHVLA